MSDPMKDKGKRMKKKISERKILLCIVLFLGFTSCIYAPYELYLTNRDEFWFQLSLFWWIPLLVGACAMLLAVGVGMLFNGKLLVLYETFLFAMAVCMYIQGNFLNLDVGVMNGAEVEWSHYYRHFLIDALILCAIIVVLMAIALKKTDAFEKAAMYASFFFSAIQLVSLLFLLIPVIASGEAGGDSTDFASDKGLYEVGEESNIIVFVLDMYDDEYFKEILSTEPEIKNELDGFTYFSNFTGSYSTTSYALAHLSTGMYTHNESELLTWVKNVSEKRQYLDELAEDGYQMYLYSSTMGCLPKRFVKVSKNYINAPLKISSKLHFTYDLYQLAALKYFPDFVKPFLWMTGTEFDYWKSVDSRYNPYSVDNLVFKEGLEKQGISKGEDARQFKFIHLNGSHYPYEIDENAKRVEADSVTAVQCARGALRIVQQYLEELKKNGSYDNSAIIITADHGYYWDGVLTNPVFMVKPKGASGELVVNDAPVCQGDFAPTVLELAGLNQDHSYGESAFEISKGSQRERYFYQYYLQERSNTGEVFRLIEYKIGSESNDPSGYELTDVEYTVNGEKIQHSKYCKTCKGEVAEDGDEYDPPRVVHEKDDGYPE